MSFYIQYNVTNNDRTMVFVYNFEVFLTQRGICQFVVSVDKMSTIFESSSIFSEINEK